MWLGIVLGVGCAGDEGKGGVAGEVEETSGTEEAPETSDPGGTEEGGTDPIVPGDYVLMGAADQLVRISMALRGVRPSAADLAAVEADPGRVAAFAEDYAWAPEFRETIKDMHAELLLVRTDNTEFMLPGTGPLQGVLDGQMQAAMSEEPLELIAEVVDQGLPYTEIVTADWTMANETASLMWDIDRAGAGTGTGVGAGWAPGTYQDGRPGAGILAASGLWQRHRSQGINANRARANLVSRALLCEDFLGRDVPLSGAIDLADEGAVADAVRSQGECVSCHQALDPVGSFFWGFQNIYVSTNVRRGESNDCRPPYDKFCYPLLGYDPADAAGYATAGLRAPSYFGADVGSGLDDLGAAIAADPRFSLCTAARFYGYLTQTPTAEVPLATKAELQASFIASGFDARQLAIDIVTRPEFLAVDHVDSDTAAALGGPLVIRPEQHGRTVEALTGFRWTYSFDPPNCADSFGCWGEVTASEADRWGFRSMTGGIDGWEVTAPSHAPTPTKLLFAAAVGAEAAHAVVEGDWAVTAAERRLLDQVEPDTTDPDAVRSQLVGLHAAILGEHVAPDGPEVDESYALFEATADPTTAWKLVISAMLQSDRILFY